MGKHNCIVWTGIWQRGHINIRRAELLRRMTGVDRYPVTLHGWKMIRGVQKRILLPVLTALAAVRYPLFFCTDRRQIRFFPRKVVYDYDDPQYSPEELAILSRRNVSAIVVPTQKIRGLLRDIGFQKPVEVVPQGVSLGTIDSIRVAAIRRQWSRDHGEIIIGLHQPNFFLRAELPPGPQSDMYAVDLLLEMMVEVHRQIPDAVLWLVGQPSNGVQKFVGGHPWVQLLGYQPHEDILNVVSAFDIGVYPRRVDYGGRGSIKIIEYMACGIPVVGMPISEMEPVEQAGAGFTAKAPDDFILRVVQLCQDGAQRRTLGQNGKTYAKEFDWDRLAERYANILKSYLP